ncbi:MAG: NINE protein [bacterium]
MSTGIIATATNNQPQVSEKSYVIAVCLSAVFGIVGIQHFYMGRWLEACLDLGLFMLALYFYFQGELLYGVLVFAIDSLHTFIVTIMLLTGSFNDGKGRRICYPGQKLVQR